MCTLLRAADWSIRSARWTPAEIEEAAASETWPGQVASVGQPSIDWGAFTQLASHSMEVLRWVEPPLRPLPGARGSAQNARAPLLAIARGMEVTLGRTLFFDRRPVARRNARVRQLPRPAPVDIR